MPEPSLLMIHGAASGAWVWSRWRQHLQSLGRQVNVLDLRGHGRSIPIDLTQVTLEDYVADIASVTAQIEKAQGIHPVMAGWSLGGLLAMMYVSQHPETPALLLLEPNPPAEIAGRAPPELVRQYRGEILDPAVFGVFPGDPARSRAVMSDLDDDELSAFLSQSEGAQESGIAMRQALRGVSIPEGSIRCPVLVVHGSGEDRAPVPDWSRKLADYVGGEALAVPQTGHWGIVAHEATVAALAPRVDAWLERALSQAP